MGFRAQRLQNVLALLSVLVLVSCTTTHSDSSEARLARLASPTLQRFENEAEFRAYIRSLRKEATQDHRMWAGGFQPTEDGDIVVTARRVEERLQDVPISISSVGEESITNNQERGVDEGDVVKRIGDHLIVLMDGRLFSVALGVSGGSMRLDDRANVYRNPRTAGWIDEMLVFGRRILVTGYNYRRGATELSIFTLGDDGHLGREAVYFLSSNDYYDPDNYATRIVNGNLVIYTPLALSWVNPDAEGNPWPVIRRWIRDVGDDEELTDGRPLFDATSIYRPLRPIADPVVHTISICPLGATAHGDELECRSEGFVSDGQREFYVTPDNIFIWTSQNYFSARDRCEQREEATWLGLPATVFQMSFSGKAPRALFARGAPPDQFSLDAANGEFRALLRDQCAWARDERDTLRYFHAPLSSFRAGRITHASSSRYTRAPEVPGGDVIARFTDTHLVYAGRTEWGSEPPGEHEARQISNIVVMPTRGGLPSIVEAPHNVVRIEPFGEGAVITGYADQAGLSVSRLDLHSTVRISDTFVLNSRYETEGRSHAFNARLSIDGDAVFALPTTLARKEAGRYVWESNDSDISFFSLSGRGRIAPLGELARAGEPEPSYHCEVSCIDWYGNARPFFIGSRIFALTGADIVEGEVHDDRIRERGRVALTAPVSPN